MPKVTLPTLGNPENSSFVTDLNGVLDTLADEFDKVVYRDGTYNFTDDLDMNSNRIFNLVAPLTATEPLRLGDAATLTTGTPGTNGTNGTNAVNPNISYVITTLDPGSTNTLVVTGTYPNLTYTFGIARGTAGSSGALGDGVYTDITVSGVGTVLTVTAGAITFAKLQSLAGAGVIGATAAGVSSLLSFGTVKTQLALVKGDVGLGNVDNTSDANKPVSTATAASITSSVAAARLLPITTAAGAFSVETSDSEESYNYTGSGHTCTVANTLGVGALVTVYNNGSGNLAITGSGVTITNLVAGNTTAFSIPPLSVVTLHKLSSGVVMASPSRTV